MGRGCGGARSAKGWGEEGGSGVSVARAGRREGDRRFWVRKTEPWEEWARDWKRVVRRERN